MLSLRRRQGWSGNCIASRRGGDWSSVSDAGSITTLAMAMEGRNFSLYCITKEIRLLDNPHDVILANTLKDIDTLMGTNTEIQ